MSSASQSDTLAASVPFDQPISTSSLVHLASDLMLACTLVRYPVDHHYVGSCGMANRSDRVMSHYHNVLEFALARGMGDGSSGSS
jgi:hypothetical protein